LRAHEPGRNTRRLQPSFHPCLQPNKATASAVHYQPDDSLRNIKHITAKAARVT
jgi:hypothetical protein